MRRVGGRARLAAALSACALGCWLVGAAVGALTAQTGATRAELSATAVVRTSAAAGTWDAAPARSRPTQKPTPTPTATQTPTESSAATPTETPSGAATETPTDPPTSSPTSS